MDSTSRRREQPLQGLPAGAERVVAGQHGGSGLAGASCSTTAFASRCVGRFEASFVSHAATPRLRRACARAPFSCFTLTAAPPDACSHDRGTPRRVCAAGRGVLVLQRPAVFYFRCGPYYERPESSPRCGSAMWLIQPAAHGHLFRCTRGPRGSSCARCATRWRAGTRYAARAQAPRRQNGLWTR